ncbi:MAG: RDD family protein [Candidatus Thorarchaeota archaeon]
MEAENSSTDIGEKQPISEIKIKEPLATISERILSGIIDALIFDAIIIAGILVPFILRLISFFYGYPILLLLAKIGWGVLFPLGVIGAFCYLIFMPITQKQTFGQRIMKIQPLIIENYENGNLRPYSKEDIIRNLKRVIFGAVDILPFTIVGLLLIRNSSLNQAFMDRNTDTVVIQIEEQAIGTEIPSKSEVKAIDEKDTTNENIKEEKSKKKRKEKKE